MKPETKYQKKILEVYVDARKAIRAEMGRLFERYAKDGKLTYAEMTRYNRLAGTEKQINTILLKTYSYNGKMVKKLAEESYEASYFKKAWEIENKAKVSLKWGLFNPATITAAIENPLEYIALEGIKRNGLIGIQRTITQGLLRGDSYQKMSRAITKFFDTDARKFMTIARTEGQRAQVLGQQDLYKDAEEMGIETTWIWDATLDGATRPEHAALDGVPAEVDGDGEHYWNTAVGRVRGPLQSGDPAFDINCRCAVREEVVGYAPELRRIRDEGVKPYETFKEWAEPKGWTPEKGWPKKK